MPWKRRTTTKINQGPAFSGEKRAGGFHSSSIVGATVRGFTLTTVDGTDDETRVVVACARVGSGGETTSPSEGATAATRSSAKENRIGASAVGIVGAADRTTRPGFVWARMTWHFTKSEATPRNHSRSEQSVVAGYTNNRSTCRSIDSHSPNSS